MTPRATMRLQFHRASPSPMPSALVPYFARLGISHLYASPITTARAGSMHGYDVIDPTRVNPELGGEAALRRLVAALRAAGLGLILDIVPNHMAVGAENAWWFDVLQARPRQPLRALLRHRLGCRGRRAARQGAAAGARQAAARGAARRRDHARARSGRRRRALFPAALSDRRRTSSDGEPLEAVLSRQHYRLAWWRIANDEINWRRFFDINELVGLRMEDPEAFEDVHALIFRLYAEGLIDGVRVDHVDGLADPAALLPRAARAPRRADRRTAGRRAARRA